MKKSTAKPNYQYGIIDNYGLEISGGTLKIHGGLSYIEHSESVFENLEMSGGDIVVNNGSMNISGKLTGTVHNMGSNCQSSLYINEYAAIRTGNYFTVGGAIYTSDAYHNKIVQNVTDLLQENQLYSQAMLREIKKKHPNDWKAIVAMKNWGLPGGGGIETVIIGAALGYGADRLFNRHHHRANVRVTIGVDHRGNVAGGFNHNSVRYQLRNQRRMQDNHTRQMQESFSSNPINQIRRKDPNHIYWKELEAMPQKIRLAKELQTLFKPVNQYYSWNHKTKIYGTYKCLDNPLNIIKNAYNMKVDTTLYQKNRNYYSNLYQSLKNAQISHSDILVVWGNPYLGVLTEWSDLSYQRKQRLVQEYPGIDETAEKIQREREKFKRTLENMMNSPIDRFIDQMVIPVTTFACSNSPYGRAYAVAKTVVLPRLGQIATAMGASELYRQYINFSKKHTNNGLKKASENNTPRIQNTPQEVMDYIKGLTDQKNLILNRGKTKDGYHYYEVIKKKFTYKGNKFKRGEYISRDTEKHEIEWFRDKDYHYGAIDPVKGNLKPNSQVPGRKLHT